MTINPWINFNGNAEAGFTFYQSVFGGQFTTIIRFKDVASADFPVPESALNNIMQIVLPIGAGSELIGNDVPAFMGTVNEQENRSKIKIATDSQAEAQRIYDGLSAGGQVEVPLSDSGDGVYFSMFRDKFGIEWVVAFNGKTQA